MARVTISGSVFQCLRGLKIGDEFSNEAIYGWCDGCGLRYYYITVEDVLQLLKLNGYIERLETSQCKKKKYRMEYKLIREIPKDFTYTQLIEINNNRKNGKNKRAIKSI